MSTALAPTALESTEIDEARTEIARLQAQVGRLQRFAFRELLALTPDELADAVHALPGSSKSKLRRFLSADPAPAVPAAIVPAAPTDDDRRQAWRQAAGLLPPPAARHQAPSS